MKTTVTTRDLLALLTDLIATAGAGKLGAIHLRTTVGYWRDEPGRTNLLAGVSSSGVVGGHTWTLASGTIEPTVWSVDDARAVIAVFKHAVKENGQSHSVDIDVDSERHVTVRETPALFDAGSELTFTGWDPADYPYGPITRALSADDAPEARLAPGTSQPTVSTAWSGPAMRAVLAVEKRNGTNLRLWRVPGTQRHLAQIGDEWRGFIFARAVDAESADATEPTADLNVEAPDEETVESPEAMQAWTDRLAQALGIPPVKPDEKDRDAEPPIPDTDTDEGDGPRPDYGDYDGPDFSDGA